MSFAVNLFARSVDRGDSVLQVQSELQDVLESSSLPSKSNLRVFNQWRGFRAVNQIGRKSTSSLTVFELHQKRASRTHYS